jgi:hypothetical protein
VRGVRRRIVVAATVGVALLGVFGAVVALVNGSSSDGSGTTSSAGSPMIAPAPEIGTAEAPGGAAGTSADDASAKSPVQPRSPGAAPDTAASGLAGRDVVRTAQLTVQVADPTAATRGVRTAVAAAGGVISEEQVDGTGAWLVVRVPAAGLDRLVDDLAATGTVLGRSGRTEDATEQVVDLDSRVATQQASVTRVRALLAQATSIGDIVSVESELARREADLDSLQRRLATLKDRVALSTLTVELRTASTPAPADPAGFGAGLGAGWSGLKVIGSGLATATGFLLPFLPLLAVAGAVVWAVRRRAGRRRGGPGPEGGI